MPSSLASEPARQQQKRREEKNAGGKQERDMGRETGGGSGTRVEGGGWSEQGARERVEEQLSVAVNACFPAFKE